MVKLITLSNGMESLVDDEDFVRVSAFKWHAKYDGEKAYAQRNVWSKQKRATQKMHRFILPDSAGKIIDHINGDGLDNRKSNLRFVTHSQNSMNSKKRVGCSSTYKGVIFDKERNKWIALVQANEVPKFLGRFKSEVEAAAAYNFAASELHGEYARLNSIPQVECVENQFKEMFGGVK